jgi:hypothetical protein
LVKKQTKKKKTNSLQSRKVNFLYLIEKKTKTKHKLFLVVNLRKWSEKLLSVVAHAFNLNYSEVGDQEDHNSRLASPGK